MGHWNTQSYLSLGSRNKTSISGAHDSFTWPHIRNGEYSIESGYHFSKIFIKRLLIYHLVHLARERRFGTSNGEFHCPKKIKLFLRKLNHNAILIKDNLYKNIVTSTIFPICEQQRESIEHALLHYPWTTL